MNTPHQHVHVWHFIHANTRDGWVWHCPCGAYRNNDGRVAEPRASSAVRKEKDDEP